MSMETELAAYDVCDSDMATESEQPAPSDDPHALEIAVLYCSKKLLWRMIVLTTCVILFSTFVGDYIEPRLQIGAVLQLTAICMHIMLWTYASFRALMKMNVPKRETGCDLWRWFLPVNTGAVLITTFLRLSCYVPWTIYRTIQGSNDHEINDNVAIAVACFIALNMIDESTIVWKFKHIRDLYEAEAHSNEWQLR